MPIVVYFSETCHVNFTDRCLYRSNGEFIPNITLYEYQILDHVTEYTNRVFEREQILGWHWGDDAYLYGARSVDTHIGNVRAFDPAIGKCFSTVTSVGYRYTGPIKAEISDEQYQNNGYEAYLKSVRTPSKKSASEVQTPITLSEVFSVVCDAGDVKHIARIDDGDLLVLDTKRVIASDKLHFLLPASAFADQISAKTADEFCKGSILTESQDVLNRFHRQTVLFIDKIWDICQEHMYEQLKMIQALKVYTSMRRSVPNKLQDLQMVSEIAERFVNDILSQLSSPIEQRILTSCIIGDFFSGKKVVITDNNAVCGLVALSLISFYYLAITTPFTHAEKYKADVERYKAALQSKIKEVFFPDTGDDNDKVSIAEVRALLDIVLAGLDIPPRERRAIIDKYIIDRKNLDAIHKNSGIRISEAAISSENESPIKIR